MTTRCHSVFSLRSPVVLSRQLSEVATLRLAIGRPSWVRRISGSLPRFPTRITLFTLPAIAALHSEIYCTDPRRLPLEAPASCQGMFKDICRRPYTLTGATDLANPQTSPVIHI